MILKSFGCSFIFGTDLHDDNRTGPWPLPSKHTWPALVAKDLGLDYACYAKGGAGNLLILDRVLCHAATNQQDLFVINWTWSDRFDYIDVVNPNPLHDWRTYTPMSEDTTANIYYKYLHSETKDKLCTLTYIKTAVSTLLEKRIPFIMTYMDEIIFDTQYHTHTSIYDLQLGVKPWMSQFQDRDFLTWSRAQGFPISDTLHPLEQAHRAAADHVLVNLDQFVKNSQPGLFVSKK